MTFYFIYAEKEKLDKPIYTTCITSPYEILIHNRPYILYAITDKKDYMKHFIDTRADIFYVTKKKISKELINDDTEKDFRWYSLEYREYISRYEKINILSTYYEYSKCVDNWFDEVIDKFESTVFTYLTSDRINLYKDKYVNALTKIGLNTMIVISSGEEVDIDYVFEDFHFLEIDDRLNSGISVKPPDPLTRNPHFECQFDIKSQSLNIFIKFFKSTLLKKR